LLCRWDSNPHLPPITFVLCIRQGGYDTILDQRWDLNPKCFVNNPLVRPTCGTFSLVLYSIGGFCIILGQVLLLKFGCMMGFEPTTFVVTHSGSQPDSFDHSDHTHHIKNNLTLSPLPLMRCCLLDSNHPATGIRQNYFAENRGIEPLPAHHRQHGFQNHLSPWTLFSKNNSVDIELS
jgi:hypothetical protein